MENGRQTELVVSITMYNESDVFLNRTLSAVFRNIRFFCTREKPSNVWMPIVSASQQDSMSSLQPYKLFSAVPTATINGSTSVASKVPVDGANYPSQIWDEDAWQKIVVVLIIDGINKCNERVLMTLNTMGVFNQAALQSFCVDEHGRKVPVIAHLFESTVQISVDEECQINGARKGTVPVQMIVCIKEKNAKKLNSHKWLFRGITPMLNPNICTLIDVGTRPKTVDSIYNLWKAFDKNKHVGGACGEICVLSSPGVRITICKV